MKSSRFTDSQIIAVLKQAEGGKPVPELCREYGISSAIFCKWRSKFGGMDAIFDGAPERAGRREPTQWMWTYNHERHYMALGGINRKQKLALNVSTSERCGLPFGLFISHNTSCR